MWCRGIFSIWISNLIERYTRRNTTCLMLVFVPFAWTCWALNYLAVVGILCVAHSGNGTEVELPQITCGGKLSNFEFSTYCPPRTGLALGQCQSGTWRKVGSGELQIATAQATGWRFPGATATCPTGKRVTGGGGICTSRTGYIWLTRSFPSANNSWSAACDTTEDQNGSITVYAICQ